MSKFQPLTLDFQDFDNFQVKKIFKSVKKSHSELTYGVICVYLYGIFLERNFWVCQMRGLVLGIQRIEGQVS